MVLYWVITRRETVGRQRDGQRKTFQLSTPELFGFGEMDAARWWNTKGQLGQLGASVLRRGFPRTFRFAQARSVFAVAAQRCAEIFDPPGTVRSKSRMTATSERYSKLT